MVPYFIVHMWVSLCSWPGAAALLRTWWCSWCGAAARHIFKQTSFTKQFQAKCNIYIYQYTKIVYSKT